MRVSLIAAIARNGVIGRDNTIPWIMRTDMKFFKETTIGRTVVMGRNTFESLPCALPNRKSVVITTNPNAVYAHENYVTNQWIVPVESIEEVRGAVRDDLHVFVIGGNRVYEAFKDIAHDAYITHIDADIEGDVTFPFNVKEVFGPPVKVIEDIPASTFDQYPAKITYYCKLGAEE